MNSLPRTSGVYQITCSANGKIYVGSSVNIRSRWIRHTYELRARKHINRHLQRAWDKYGADAFTITVLELCDTTKRIEREQHYLDTLSPFDELGFNIGMDAVSPALGLPVSEATRAKISAAHKGKPKSIESRMRLSATLIGKPNGRKGQKFSDEHRANISKSAKGKQTFLGKKHTPQTRAKMKLAWEGRTQHPNSIIAASEATRKQYVVTSPEGVEIEVNGLRRFCFAHELDESAMSKVANGKYKHHHGWKCRHA